MFPDPSLTPENLSSVLDIMEDVLWAWFSRYVNIPESEIEEIRRQSSYSSSDRDCKLAVSPHLISTHPSLSWTLVAHALYRMGTLYALSAGGAVSCHRALDHLQQKFPTGNTYCIQHQYGPLPARDSPAGAGAYLPPTFTCPPREIFPAGAGALAILVWLLAPMHKI